MSGRSTTDVRIIIAGGGTGGHVFPAMAIQQAIVECEPQATIIFVGTSRGLEATVIPRAGQRLVRLWISGFSRNRMLVNLLLPVKLIVSLLQSLWLLLTFRPHLVIGTGGYVMGPMLYVAQTLGTPTLLQEQNSRPGYTTRRLAQRAKLVCAAFEEVRDKLASAHVEITGNPLRSSFRLVERTAATARWNLEPARKTLLVVGGSAGARSINVAVGASIGRLTASFNVIWQTGRLGLPADVDLAAVHTATAARHLVVLEFIEDMPAVYGAADLAVCRAGAMTLSELSAAGVPAVLIPYPFAANDHQTANARAYVAAGAAQLIADKELGTESLLATVERCLRSETELATMRERMRSLAKPEAARRIAEIALSLARNL